LPLQYPPIRLKRTLYITTNRQSLATSEHFSIRVSSALELAVRRLSARVIYRLETAARRSENDLSPFLCGAMADGEQAVALAAFLGEHGYDLLEQIGVGSYGLVYTVLSRKYSGIVFVAKVMTLPAGGPSAQVFDREIEMLTNLAHPHIVSLYDTFQAGCDFVLILEFCGQGTIDRYVRLQRLPEAQIVRMLRQVLSALAHCHALGIAHRDLKPANILIDHYGRPKLADFGLSCFARGGADGARVAGSLSYMAPELVARHDAPDLLSADIWSLGITFFVLFVGATPWPRLAVAPELMEAIARGVTAFPETLRPPVRQFLARMLALDPAARPGAAELMADPIFAALEPRTAPARCKETSPGPRRPSGGALSTRVSHALSVAPTAVVLGRPTLGLMLGKRGSGPDRRPTRVLEVENPRRNSVFSALPSILPKGADPAYVPA
jgi:serine/threonine protein kinase